MTPSITISPAAGEQLREELGEGILRIAFTTGCGGSGFRLSSAASENEGDVVIETAGVKIALDEMSASRLDGAVIIYDDEEEGYSIDHPDAVAAVWCG